MYIDIAVIFAIAYGSGALIGFIVGFCLARVMYRRSGEKKRKGGE